MVASNSNNPQWISKPLEANLIPPIKKLITFQNKHFMNLRRMVVFISKLNKANKVPNHSNFIPKRPRLRNLKKYIQINKLN